jgi:hypothetical protein
MNKFPKEINICNKKLDLENYSNNFKEYNSERITKIFRNDIYSHIISRKEENDYYDIEDFCKRYNYDKCNFTVILNTILDELENLGWKSKLSFGDTAIFIYSTKEPPRSCW